MYEKTLISIGKLSKFSRVPRTKIGIYGKKRKQNQWYEPQSKTPPTSSAARPRGIKPLKE